MPLWSSHLINQKMISGTPSYPLEKEKAFVITILDLPVNI